MLRGGHLQQLHHFDFIGFGPASFDYVFHVVMIYGAKAPVEIFILHPGLKARAIHYKFYSMVVSLF